VVKREDFVPPAYRALAFVDSEIPLPEGQCMLAPRVEARLLQELQLQRHESVLEVGAGSGFMAALLAHRARQVISLEIEPVLAQMAQDNLRRAAVVNATVRCVDGRNGDRGEAPFDAILLSGSVAAVPQPLLDQLKVGGRLAAIVGDEPVMRARLYRRVDDASWSEVDLFDTVAPRLRGFPETERFSF
jgi:protein-L-isoaspartate(D-aspartate) O-methyltransferase